MCVLLYLLEFFFLLAIESDFKVSTFFEFMFYSYSNLTCFLLPLVFGRSRHAATINQCARLYSSSFQPSSSRQYCGRESRKRDHHIILSNLCGNGAFEMTPVAATAAGRLRHASASMGTKLNWGMMVCFDMIGVQSVRYGQDTDNPTLYSAFKLVRLN